MKTISQMMDILLAEVIAELRRRDRLDGLCAKSLYPGASVPPDYALECEGMAYVQMMTAAPSATFPSPSQDINNCSYSLAYTVNVGIVRGVKIPEQGSRGGFVLPSDEDNTEATYAQMEDMDIMHTAIRNASKDIDYLLLGNYASEGPEGGAVVGYWTVQIGNEDPE